MKKNYFLLMALMLLTITNYGQITFGNKKITNINKATSSIKNIKIADLDNDGIKDLVVAAISSYHYYLVKYKGHSSGLFDSEIELGNGNFSNYQLIPLELRDVNNDSLIDIIFTKVNSSTNKVAWIENYGYNAFSGGKYLPDLPLGPFYTEPRGLGVGDIDNDGDNDILCYTHNQYNSNNIDYDILCYSHNNGSGSFTQWDTIFITSDNYGDNVTILIEDFNNDNHSDIFFQQHSVAGAQCGLYLITQNGTNAFSIDTITTTMYNTIKAVDIDNDGDLDILAGRGGHLDLYVNNSQGVFTLQTISNQVNGSVYVDCGDLDKDGKIDVLSYATGDKRISYYMNQGNNTFSSQHIIDVLTNGDGALLKCEDLNNDKMPDIVYVKGTSVVVRLNTTTPNSIEDLKAANISITPNPTSNTVNIQMESTQLKYQGEIYDMNGKLIRSFIIKNGKKTINLSDEAKGVYLIKIISGKQVYTHKLIVN